MEFKMQTRPTPSAAITLEKASFFPRVYGWIALGLLVSAVASFGLLSSPSALKFVFGSKVVYFGLILGALTLYLDFVNLFRCSCGCWEGGSRALLTLPRGPSPLSGPPPA